MRTLFVRFGFSLGEHPQGRNPIGQGEGLAVRRAPEKRQPDDDSDLVADFDAAARLEPASGEAPDLDHCTPGVLQRVEHLGEVRMALEFFDLRELQEAARLICTDGKCAQEMKRSFDDTMKLRTFLQRTVEDMDLRTLVRIADCLEHMGFHQLGKSSE